MNVLVTGSIAGNPARDMQKATWEGIFRDGIRDKKDTVPGMLEGLSACKPLLHIYTHKLANKILSRVTDVVPVRGIEFELAWWEKNKMAYFTQSN